MRKFFRDFISNEARAFRFRIGEELASSLAGFVAGIIAASAVWVLAATSLQFLGR